MQLRRAISMMLVAALISTVVSIPAVEPHTIHPRKIKWHHRLRKRKPLASRSATLGVSYSDWRAVKLTWYSSQQGYEDGRVTYTGANVRNGMTIAVDPNVIPLHSVVEIQFADGTTHMYEAQDIGGAVRGYHIDIYESDDETCVRNGVQQGEYRIVTLAH